MRQVKLLEKEKGIPADYLMEKIQAAIVIAVKRDYGGKENIRVVMDPATSEFAVSLYKTVVEEVEDPDVEMTMEEAARYSKTAKVGDTVEIPLETKEFGRIAAQTAKHVIRQGIREAERGQQMPGIPAPQSGAGDGGGYPHGSPHRSGHGGDRLLRSRPAEK